MAAGVKVLVLGAGGAAANGFARALRLAGGYQLVGTNCNETDLLLSECEENHVVPHVSDYDAWRTAIHQLCRKVEPDFVHAQADPEVEALGRFREPLHKIGVRTWLPADETITVCRDKWLSYQAWERAGIRVPLTRLCSTRDMVSSIIGQGDHASAWMRPRIGAGGQKSFVARSYREAVWWLERHHGWDEFTIAEQLTADSVTVQQLYWNGLLVVSQQRRRESWANSGSTTTGVSGSTGVGVSSSSREADRVADRAVAAVDRCPHGLYGVDMTYDQFGTPCPTEINVGRFFTTAPEFMAMAGFNMADFFVQLAGIGPHQGQMNIRNPLPDGKRWIRSMDHMPVLA